MTLVNLGIKIYLNILQMVMDMILRTQMNDNKYKFEGDNKYKFKGFNATVYMLGFVCELYTCTYARVCMQIVHMYIC
jgi:hypothetical protein